MEKVYVVSYRHDGDDTHVSGIMRVFKKEEDASEYEDFLLDKIKKIVRMEKSKVRGYIYKNLRTDPFDISVADDWAEAAEGNYHFHVFYEEHKVF